VAQSTRAALDYLQFLHREFKGDWLLALAAYNSGEGTVRSAVRRNEKRGKPTDFWSLDLPNETRGYVPRLLAISRVVSNPTTHGLTLDAVDNQPFLAAVDVGSQIDLDLVAELSELTVEEVYRYNPGFNRWATDPDGPHTLLLPIDIAADFEERLSRYPTDERISWTRHRIRGGETLGAIADRYRSTIPLIKRVNNIRGNTIRAGDNLVIPVARQDLNRYRLSADQRLATLQKQDNGRQRVDYEVREGDTLWDIAQSYAVGVRTLAQWNGMAPRDTLRPGQRLVIWRRKSADKAETVSAINPVNFNHPMEQKAQQRIGYTVRKGDSLARISQRFRVSIDALKRWNKLTDDRYLQPGQKLTLYVDVTSQSGSI
jgi:membrane-bound lytic murein transglycosylase D